MSLSPHPRAGQAEIAARFAAFQAEARPVPPTARPAAEMLAARARRLARQRRYAWIARLPWVGPFARKFWRVWGNRDLSWRGKLRATPGVARPALWGWALLKAHETRQRVLALEGLRPELEALRLDGAGLRHEVAALRHEVAVLHEVLAALPRGAGAAEGGEGDDPGLPAAVYVALEDRFRGARADIARRLEAYVPSVLAVHQALALPVADIGCGRGEWLSRLRMAGVAGRGVDCNTAMVQTCRAQGLAVEEGDGLGFLLSQPAASLGAVTVFHVVEHLPSGALWALLRAAQRALAPGGLLILETPNPENLQVAAYSFRMDPSHRQPLPPPLLDFLVGQAGFETVDIMRHNPWPEFLQTEGGGEVGAGDGAAYPPYLRKLLFCEQDYALLARRREGL